MMKYELWDTGAQKYFGEFETENAAVDYARDLVATNGEDYVNELAIGNTEDEWGDENITGQALLAKIRRTDVASDDDQRSSGWSTVIKERITRPLTTLVPKMAAKARQ